MIRFSVIVPNYNHGAFLEERIQSILNQTYPHYELILLDDASSDSSRSMIESYRSHPQVKAIDINTVNSGSVFLQWQKGISMAANDWVWIAESDDSADPHFLEACAEKIADHNSLSMVCVQSHWTNEQDEIWFTRRTAFEQEGLHAGRQVLADYMLQENQIKNASAVVFNKSRLLPEELKALSTYKWCGDWALWNLLLSKGDLYFIDRPLNIFRRHPAASSHGFYQEGYLFSEGLPLSLSYQRLLHTNLKRKASLFYAWTHHLLRQYQEVKGKGLRLFLFTPLYYCVLMHLALPFAALKKVFKKK